MHQEITPRVAVAAVCVLAALCLSGAGCGTRGEKPAAATPVAPR